MSAEADSYDGPEPLLWAAGYAASTKGRGAAVSGWPRPLAALPWAVAAAKMVRLGEAAAAWRGGPS